LLGQGVGRSKKFSQAYWEVRSRMGALLFPFLVNSSQGAKRGQKTCPRRSPRRRAGLGEVGEKAEGTGGLVSRGRSATRKHETGVLLPRSRRGFTPFGAKHYPRNFVGPWRFRLSILAPKKSRSTCSEGPPITSFRRVLMQPEDLPPIFSDRTKWPGGESFCTLPGSMRRPLIQPSAGSFSGGAHEGVVSGFDRFVGPWWGQGQRLAQKTPKRDKAAKNAPWLI